MAINNYITVNETFLHHCHDKTILESAGLY